MTFITEAQASQILRQYMTTYGGEHFLLNDTIYILVLSRQNNQLYLDIWLDALSVNGKSAYSSYPIYRAPLGCDIDVKTISSYLFPLSMNKNSEGILWTLHMSSQSKAAKVFGDIILDFEQFCPILTVSMPKEMWSRDLK